MYCHIFTYLDYSNEVKKWLQQYRAMFIKRYINFKRFRVGLFCQVVLPMLFVVIGLVVVAVVALPDDLDPPRSLDIKTSSPNSMNITLFFGQFGGKEFPFIPEVCACICVISSSLPHRILIPQHLAIQPLLTTQIVY